MDFEGLQKNDHIYLIIALAVIPLIDCHYKNQFLFLSFFQEKEAELEMMRRGRKEQRDFFKKMESGQLDERPTASKEQRLVRNIKDVSFS